MVTSVFFTLLASVITLFKGFSFINKRKKTTRKYLSINTGKMTLAKYMWHHFFAELGEMLKVRVKQSGGWILRDHWIKSDLPAYLAADQLCLSFFFLLENLLPILIPLLHGGLHPIGYILFCLLLNSKK